jgi:hypothetical protein
MEHLKQFLDKIIANSNHPDKNGCWNWQGSITGSTADNEFAGGYGNFNVGGKTRYAHNLSYLLLEVLKDKNLDDYTDAQILTMLDAMRQGKSKVEGSHSCQNRRCVNPDHQIRESHTDNGRRPNGKNIKLDVVKVAEIKRLLLDGEGCYKIGPKYGVTAACINKIKTGAAWGDIKPAAKADVTVVAKGNSVTASIGA